MYWSLEPPFQQRDAAQSEITRLTPAHALKEQGTKFVLALLVLVAVKAGQEITVVTVGLIVGDLLGTIEGKIVGLNVGKNVRALEGTAEGTIVSIVGTAVCVTVGTVVGVDALLGDHEVLGVI
mmetsp:Transcript_14850/g.21997  ORF Transcript_14850/g.21997 Transcript_14850/m.21997 type:complete len:123 (+) Transcript_14850:305-673(+)